MFTASFSISNFSLFILLIFSDYGIGLSQKCAVIAQGPSPVVTLPNQGQLQGVIRQSRSGRSYFGYLGIPYAAPPTRFKDSEPPLKWEGLKIANSTGSQCVQMLGPPGQVFGSEDCLLLNIFTPSLNPAARAPFSTIFYIHGGALMVASGGRFGPDYFMDEDVVFISINYRLGAFGFLNTEDGAADANIALKDQRRALLWVRENIHLFGGNPQNITIFGGSAGAASVAYHVISPMSDGLFQKAITSSMSAESVLAFDPNPKENAIKLATQLNCPTNNSVQMIECLKGKDPADFVNRNYSSSLWPLDPVAPFLPSIENPGSQNIFLSDHPTNLLQKGLFSKVPLLTGVTKNEGLAIHARPILNDPALIKQLNENWNAVAPLTFSYEYYGLPTEKWNEVSEKIRTFYFGDKLISKDTADIVEKIYSDRNFFQGVRQTILTQAKHDSPVYPYFLDYDESGEGVAHGDDLPFLFKQCADPNDPLTCDPDFESNSTAEIFSENLVKLFVSFANHGEPVNTWGDITWPKTSLAEALESEPLRWLHLNKELTLEPETEDFRARMQFWKDIFTPISDNNSGYQISTTGYGLSVYVFSAGAFLIFQMLTN